MTVHMGATAKAVSGDALVIADADGQETLIPADRILVAVGRRPATQGWGIENMALAIGTISVHTRPRLVAVKRARRSRIAKAQIRRDASGPLGSL